MAIKKTKVELSAKTSKYEKSMRNVQRVSKKTSQSLMSHWKSVAGVFALAGGIGGIGLLTKSFLTAATTAEGFKVRLNTLLGSVEEGTRAFKEMSEFAGQVSYKYEEIMGATTILSGVMRGGVDEIKQWMPMITDLAAVTGLTLQETTGQIVRMYSAGAASADLFRERGILAMMGFKAGVSYTAEETKKIMFASWNAQESKFKGVSKDLAKTWEGMMSMIGDKWFQLRTMIMDAGLFDEMKKNLEGFNKAFGDWIKNNKELIQQKVPEYVEKLKEGLEDVWWAAQKVGWSMGIIKDTMELTYKTLTPTPGVVWPWEHKTWKERWGDKGPKFYPVTPPKFYPVTHPSETPTSDEVQRTKEYYKELEGLTQEKRDFALEIEDEEMRMFKENLAYRLELNQQYYSNIETAAQEARDLEEELEGEKMRMARETAAYQKRITENEAQTRLNIYQSIAGQIAGTFMQIAQAGGKQSKKAFLMYQAFAIVQAGISGYMAYVKTLAEPALPFPSNVIMAKIIAGMTAVQIAMIAAAKPPSYDQGGISRAAGVYQTGPIAEAHVPLKGGAIPVNLSGGSQKPIIIIHMENPVFQDLETQRQVFVQIADIVAREVAPEAVIQNYNDDLGIRQMIRGNK